MSSFGLSEEYGNRPDSRRDWHLSTNYGIQPLGRTSSHTRWSQVSIKHFFCDVFLPQGYPDSVTDDYLEYQLWDTLQAFLSSINGTLATEAVLKGVGVGDQAATPLAATITWLLKDGTGMVGRIFFAWARGTQLDSDCKKWRLFADVLNDFSIFLDLLAPHFRPFFTYIVCMSSLCRSIVGVAGGATRAALTQHQARRNNLADVSAKDGSQETLVNLSALICSLIIMPVLSGKMTLIWTLFCILAIAHICANYKAVRALRMETLNRKRMEILIRNWHNGGSIMDVKTVNSLEPIASDFFPSPSKFRLNFGCSLTDFKMIRSVDVDLMTKLRYDRFLIGVHPKNSRLEICVLLAKDATNDHVLQAAFHAMVLTETLPRSFSEGWTEEIKNEHKKSFESFRFELLTKGWETEHLQLNFDEWRYEITNE